MFYFNLALFKMKFQHFNKDGLDFFIQMYKSLFYSVSCRFMKSVLFSI